MKNKDFILGVLLLFLGFLIITSNYYIPNINIDSVYKLFGIPLTYMGIKKIRGEKIF